MNKSETIAKLRDRLAGGGISVGSWMQFASSSVAELMGQSGYDWVAADLEHGSFSTFVLPDVFRALELGGTLPFARLAQGSVKDCKLALDAGAAGVIIPMVESASQLEEVREACCWPPAGSRGVGFSRANLFGRNFSSYREEAQAPFLVAMIEHRRGVENLSEILKVPGLDAILIGPYDLSASLGFTAQFQEPSFLEAMTRIHKLAAEAGVPCGVHVVDPAPDQLNERIAQGFRFLAYSIDAVLLGHNALNPFKNEIGTEDDS